MPTYLNHRTTVNTNFYNYISTPIPLVHMNTPTWEIVETIFHRMNYTPTTTVSCGNLSEKNGYCDNRDLPLEIQGFNGEVYINSC